MSKKLKVAVTGGIGSGKSFFCSILKGKGYTVLNADEISKGILEHDPVIRKEIVKSFGKNAYKDGKPDKKYLAEKVFSHEQYLLKINSILHPAVIQKQNEMLERALVTSTIVFLEAALIYEADVEEEFDHVVLITADDSIRKQRKVSEGMSEEEFIRRSENQIPDSEKVKRADFIFMNNGTEEELRSKATLLLTILNGFIS